MDNNQVKNDIFMSILKDVDSILESKNSKSLSKINSILEGCKYVDIDLFNKIKEISIDIAYDDKNYLPLVEKIKNEIKCFMN